MTKLKPCPFCGGSGEVKKSWVTGVDKSFYTHYVECTVCGAKTHAGIARPTQKKAAADRWNRRASLF